MFEIFLPVLFVFLMIDGCVGPYYKGIKWTHVLNEKLMDIHYETSPDRRGHSMRMKQEWDKQHPEFRDVDSIRLRRHARLWTMRLLQEWDKKAESEKHELERRLSIISSATNNREPNHEKQILEKLIKDYPEYQREFPLIRAVVYKWCQEHNDFSTELHHKHVNWEPQLKADLMHIANQVQWGEGAIRDRIKSRWSQMHGDLNVKDNILLNYAYKLKRSGYEPTAEEKEEAKKKYDILFPPVINEPEDKSRQRVIRKLKWSSQQNADILFIRQMTERKTHNIKKTIQEEWSKMYKNLSYMTGENLLKHVSRLKQIKYEPTPEEMKIARMKYERLSAIPSQLSRKEKEGKSKKGTSSSHRNNNPIDMGMLNHTGYLSKFKAVHHSESSKHTPVDQVSYSSQFHLPNSYQQLLDGSGSSNHTLFDQVPLGSQLHLPNPYNHHWDHGASSSYTPIDQTLFDPQLYIPNLYQHPFHERDSSGHTLFDQVPFGSQIHLPNPYHHQWDQGASSSHTPIDQAPFDSQLHIPDLYQHPLHEIDSSNHNFIDPIPFGSQLNVPNPYHYQWNEGGSSNNHQVPLGLEPHLSGTYHPLNETDNIYSHQPPQ